MGYTDAEFIYLNENDMITAGVSDMGRCIHTMEEMFDLVTRGDYRMGGATANEHGIKITFPDTSDIKGMPLNEPDRRFMAMPAYLGGKFHLVGNKMYGSNQKNAEKGLPRSILMLTLMDVDTGMPLAYMSANILSAMRTAAVTGLGTKYLAKKNPKSVAIVGPGVMGRYAMDAFMETQPSLQTIKIKGRGTRNIDHFISHCKKRYPQIKNYTVCDSIQKACENSDIIYFGTTNAAAFEDNPNIEEEWIKPGSLVISVSALRVKTDFIAKEKCKLVTDSYHLYESWGMNQKFPTQKHVSSLLGLGFYDAVCEGKIEKADITDIGDIITAKEPGRESDEQIVIYAIGGMPIEDVAWGYECYLQAKNKHIGTKLKIWDTSELMKE